MSNSFNLQKVLGEQESYLKRTYTGAEVRQEAMENNEIKQAQAAVAAQGTFLAATLKGKIGEYYGPRVQQQLVDTAVNAVAGIVAPVNDYLEKYDYIISGEADKEMQANLFQMWSTNNELQKAAVETFGVGEVSFIMDM